MRLRSFALVAVACLSIPARSQAANVLVISNVGGDTNIAAAVMADGHDVTSMSGYTGLAGDLAEYDVIFWSATGSFAVPAETFTNLNTWVMNGGHLFITGYDSIISNTSLANLAGGASARDLVGSPGPGVIADVANSLTVGVVDLRGMTPTDGHTDRDGLVTLMMDTVEVVQSVGGGSSQWTLRTLGAGEVAWVSNGTYGGVHASWESRTSVFNGAIRNFAAGGDSAMTEAGAPEIAFSDVRSLDEGGAFSLEVTVDDLEGDAVTFSWDTDDDGEFGELAGMTSFEVAAGVTDGPGSMRIGVQAMDTAGHTSTRYRRLSFRNVGPMITSSPGTFSSVGAAYVYQIEVLDPGGALDAPTYTLVRAPMRMVVSDSGRITWTPNETEVTIGSETVSVEVSVDDGDGAIASQQWEMTVSPNRAPSPPSPVYPVGVLIDDVMPRLATTNAVDQDRDTLTYFFQVDSTDTFDSPALQESGPIAETVGFTAWRPNALDRGQTWHWRVWVTDGTVETEPQPAEFTVWLEPGARPDAGPFDGDAGPTIPGPTLDDGSGCSAGGTPSGAVALGLLALVAWRRRR
jgi:MYXO-CTERM domain-containing protein